MIQRGREGVRERKKEGVGKGEGSKGEEGRGRGRGKTQGVVRRKCEEGRKRSYPNGSKREQDSLKKGR